MAIIMIIIGLILNFTSMFMAIDEDKRCWPVAIVSMIATAVGSYYLKDYPDLYMQVPLLIISIYGWWRWSHLMLDGSILQISHETDKETGIHTIAGIVLFTIAYILLLLYTNMPYVTGYALAIAYGILSQYVMAEKKVECWIYLGIASIVVVILSLIRDEIPMAIISVIVAGISVKGFYTWKRRRGL